ncbi:MAG: hypothetical protein FWF66_05625 [Candidatus Bathyarchaeota archaeon]|nr:hypothetical protein [Candidatus Termiticorpusculum sp.]MCL1970917.1 hypothetical protein [Candidatus Termiticorpusculum sp.]
MKKSNIRRKTFVVREDLLDRVGKIAKEQCSSQFELINELFQLVIDSDELKFSLKRVVEDRKIIETAKVSGFVLGLERLWYDLADVAYAKDKRASLRNWFESGVWFATRYTTSGVTSSPFDQFRNDLSAFTWNAPELKFELTGENVSINVTSPRFTEGYTFLFASFIVGAMEKFGYKTVKQEISRGIIRLNVVRSGKEDGTA